MRTPLATFVILTLALGACSDETTTPTAVVYDLLKLIIN